MGPRGAGAAGPVLLACRQWDPLGLARRLPSLGVGAWRCAPLLPWRVQCPVCVCAALAAGSGGSGRYLVLCLSRFPLPAPRVPRCVWRAVPSGCPLPSLAGTPFHAVCAIRALGPVAILVVPACPFRVCALALPRRPLPPPPLGGVACAPRVVPALGADRAVPRGPCPSACPAPVPCSVWRAWGGGGPVPVPPYLAWGCGSGGRASPGGVPSTVARGVWGQALPLPRLPAHWAGCWGPRSTCCGRGRAGVGALLCPLGLHALWGLRAAGRVRGVRVPGGGLGGGGGAPYPPFVRPGGACRAGCRSASFRPSGFPGQATKRVSLASCCPWGAWPPIPLRVRARPPFLGAICAASWRVGAGSLVPPRPPWEPAAGRGGGSRSGSSLWRGGGPSPLPRGVGAGAPAACGPVGGWGGGGSRRGLPAPLLGGGMRYSILAPLVSSAHSLPACACGRGRSAAPGWGGVRGGPWTAPPGAPADLNPPSALPEWAVVTGGSCGARPPYCSVARVAPARWCGLAPRPRPPREQVHPHPPPPRVAVPSGGGGRPLGSGGAEGRSCGSLAGGGAGGGGGGAPPRPVGRRPAFRCPRRAPPGYTRAVGVAGRPRASGAVRSAADGSVRRGGGGGPPRPGSRPRLPRAGL